MTDTEITTDPIASLTAAVERLESQVAKIAGFAADDDEWEWVECDGESPWEHLRPRDGAEPLRAEILVSLTIAQAQQVPFEVGRERRRYFPALLRCVRDWNITALNLATGEYEKVPPPPVGGEDSLRAAKGSYLDWLAFIVKFSHLRNHFPKSPPTASDTPASPNGGDSASPPPSRSRRNPKAMSSP